MLNLDHNRLVGPRTEKQYCERAGVLITDYTGADENYQGLKALGEALKENKALTSLSMRKAILGPKGAMALAAGLVFNGSLNALYLEDNLLCGVQSLGHGPHESYDPRGIGALAEALAVNTSLNTLILDNNQLAGCTRHPHWHVEGGNIFTEHDSDEKEDCPKALGDALRQNTALTSLSMQGNSLGVRCATALAGGLACNRSLKTLNLSGNALGSAGTCAIATAFSRNEDGVVNTSLTTLDLSNNRIAAVERRGVVIGAGFVQALEKGGHLPPPPLSLMFYPTYHRPRPIYDIAPDSDYSSGDDSGYDSCDSGIAMSPAEWEKYFDNCYRQQIIGSDAGDDHADHDDGIMIPSSCSHRRDCSGIEALARAMEAGSSLTALTVWGNRLDVAEAQALTAAAASCNPPVRLCGSLLEGRGQVCEDSLGAAEALLVAHDLSLLCHSMTSLDVSESGLAGEAARQLAQAAALQPAMRQFCNVPLHTMRSNTLTQLDLTRHRISIPGAWALHDLLASSCGLLHTVTVTTGVDLPIGALRANDLTELSFRRGQLLGPEDAIILAASVAHNTSLAVLDVQGNRLQVDGARALVSAAQKRGGQPLKLYHKMPPSFCAKWTWTLTLHSGKTRRRVF
ncbi:hypothetical protein CYMTET_4850 [Cymbomonas tetramitiformis]|uniref:Uncharacterized protein n=1 Tax=Cymbomonas tetramitiformis TaxID=36881 RepID=A0AAE0H0E5_9CHLO|nr:hypothetical protein CYMTET_4850 [Cymbomonas tetramitiformis]